MSRSHEQTAETDAPFTVSKTKRLTASLEFWVAVIVITGGGVAAWVRAEMKADVTAGRVDKVEVQQVELAREQRAQRDILIRIDANVSAMKEAARE